MLNSHTHTLTVNFPIYSFPIIHRKWFLSHLHQSQVAMSNMVFLYQLFIVFVFVCSLFLSPSCLFVSLMFLFKASKDAPYPLPPSQHPPSPRAVRMICKLQTTKSPSLVSSAHLGNSISQGGEAQRSAAPPPLLPSVPLLFQLKPLWLICNKCQSALQVASVKRRSTTQTGASY